MKLITNLEIILFSSLGEVRLERFTSDVEPQEVVISSDDVTPLASYVISPSLPGSILEVTLEDGSTNLSQGLCRNVEVEIYLGWFLRSLIGCFMAGTGTMTAGDNRSRSLSLSQKKTSALYIFLNPLMLESPWVPILLNVTASISAKISKWWMTSDYLRSSEMSCLLCGDLENLHTT